MIRLAIAACTTALAFAPASAAIYVQTGQLLTGGDEQGFVLFDLFPRGFRGGTASVSLQLSGPARLITPNFDTHTSTFEVCTLLVCKGNDAYDASPAFTGSFRPDGFTGTVTYVDQSRVRVITPGDTLYYTTDQYRVNFAVAGDSPLSYTLTVDTGVPEPTSWAMLLGGFGMLGAAIRRNRSIAYA